MAFAGLLLNNMTFTPNKIDWIPKNNWISCNQSQIWRDENGIIKYAKGLKMGMKWKKETQSTPYESSEENVKQRIVKRSKVLGVVRSVLSPYTA